MFVAGAEPGDVLEVQFLDYETPDFGINCVIPGFGFLADLFTEPFLVPWELDGTVARSAELPGSPFPPWCTPAWRGWRPHTADGAATRAGGGDPCRRRPGGRADARRAHPPTAANGLRTIPPRETGGNLDIRRLTAGSTLLLPVHVPGALFSLGDVHFAQGDGEVCGTGIEIAATVTVRFGLRKAPRVAARPRVPGPRAPRPRGLRDHRRPEHDPMDLTAARAALLAMIDWLEAEHGLSRPAAYCLCSACVDLHLSQVVDVPYPLVSALVHSTSSNRNRTRPRLHA